MFNVDYYWCTREVILAAFDCVVISNGRQLQYLLNNVPFNNCPKLRAIRLFAVPAQLAIEG